MSLAYLETLESNITRGKVVFTCPNSSPSDWLLSKSKNELNLVAQEAANRFGFPVSIYRIVSATEPDVRLRGSYLVATKIREMDEHGEPQIEWSKVGTKNAAEQARDVSFGPSPYFGIIPEAEFKPNAPMKEAW